MSLLSSVQLTSYDVKWIDGNAKNSDNMYRDDIKTNTEQYEEEYKTDLQLCKTPLTERGDKPILNGIMLLREISLV